MSSKIKDYYKKLAKSRSPLKRIRAKCLDCSAYQLGEIKKCPVEDCPLWQLRMGHKPKKVG